MPSREHYENEINVRRAPVLVLTLGLLLLALLAGDLFMRFHWFRWHETIYIKPLFTADQPVTTVKPSFTSLELAEGRGGDLSRLISVPSARKRYEEYRPAESISIDPHGFRNLPYPDGQEFQVVVVGDSYMAEGIPLTNQIAARLSEALGEPVLNRAFMGRGPFQSLMLWLEQHKSTTNHPNYLVWGFVERDISGSAFAGYVYLIERHLQMGEQKEIMAREASRVFLWSRLQPAELRRSLPNSSAIAQLSRKAWAFAGYYLFGALPQDIFSFDAVAAFDGGPMLGYQSTLDSMYWSRADRDLDKVVWAITYIRDHLATMGITLIVVPIPDKEQVYYSAIPRSLWKDDQPPQVSILPELVQRLQDVQVPTVSLLPVYHEAATNGVPLYWRDDTHWRPEGIKLAAELIAGEVGRILEKK